MELMPTFEQYSQALEQLTDHSSPEGYSTRHIDPFANKMQARHGLGLPRPLV
jgi:hypothetical protein